MIPKSRDEIKRLIIDTLKPLGVLRISLFGSFAREEESPQDIDILVQLPELDSMALLQEGESECLSWSPSDLGRSGSGIQRVLEEKKLG